MATQEVEVFICEKYHVHKGWNNTGYPFRIASSKAAFNNLDQAEKSLLAPGWTWEEEVGWSEDPGEMKVDADNWSYANAFPPHYDGLAKADVQSFVRWRRQVRTQNFSATAEELAEAVGVSMEAPFCSNFNVDVADKVGLELVKGLAKASFTYGEWSDSAAVILKTDLLKRLADPVKDSTNIEAFLNKFDKSQKGLGGAIAGWFGGGETAEVPFEDLKARIEQVSARFITAELDMYAVLAMRKFYLEAVCHATGAEPHDACPLRIVCCQNAGCGARFSANMAEAHDASCPYKVIVCELCSAEVLQKDWEQHNRRICPERAANCLFSEVGCKAHVKHYDMEKHLAASIPAHVRMMGVTLVEHKRTLQEFTAKMAQIDTQVTRQVEALQRCTTSRQRMEAQQLTLESRQNAFEAKTYHDLKNAAYTAERESRRRADGVQYSERQMLGSIQQEVRKLAGSEMQQLKKDVEMIRNKLK